LTVVYTLLMTKDELDRMNEITEIDGPLTVEEAQELRKLEQKWRWDRHYGPDGD